MMTTYIKCGTVKINEINKMIYMKDGNLYITYKGKKMNIVRYIHSLVHKNK
jgi:hypothetical protein